MTMERKAGRVVRPPPGPGQSPVPHPTSANHNDGCQWATTTTTAQAQQREGTGMRSPAPLPVALPLRNPPPRERGRPRQLTCTRRSRGEHKTETTVGEANGGKQGMSNGKEASPRPLSRCSASGPCLPHLQTGRKGDEDAEAPALSLPLSPCLPIGANITSRMVRPCQLTRARHSRGVRYGTCHRNQGLTSRTPCTRQLTWPYSFARCLVWGGRGAGQQEREGT
jgi:hypothetical protein